MKILTSIAVVSMCLGSVAFAADSATKAADTMKPASSDTKMDMANMGKPAPEMAKMKGMAGTWKCEGKSADMGKPTMHPVKATMTSKMALDGHWMEHTYQETKTKENAMPFSFKEIVGWDSMNKKYVRYFVDNMGGMMTAWAAPADATGKMEWTGDSMMNGQKMAMKDVITMKGEKETLVDVQMQGPDGAWMPVANLTCKK